MSWITGRYGGNEENNTEFLFTGFNVPALFNIPLSLYGHTNLLVNSTGYNYHGQTYLCQLLLSSGSEFFSAPVTFFVYGKNDEGLSISNADKIDGGDGAIIIKLKKL